MAAKNTAPPPTLSSAEEQKQTQSRAIKVPSISLPKGGGAIKGIDEKFSVNAVNGTASLSIPLPFSQARGASPALTLSYNSGAGNGIFGLGWQLDLPSITRKTDKRLPKYQDDSDSDVFLFSGAEDLVPAIVLNNRPSPNNQYLIRYYRPRIEGLFARIERWTHKNTGAIKWRVISKENVTTLFGWSSNSRLCDPGDPGRVFQWLPEVVFDDNGNCSRFFYKREDHKGFDPKLLHNKNRHKNQEITYTNLYFEKILYGNNTPWKNVRCPVSPCQ